MNFGKEDKEFMKLALDEAEKNLGKENYPVAAVLVINGEIIGINRNQVNEKNDWISHAEKQLVEEFSSKIKEAVRNDKHEVTIYSTLEPCLMCLGTIVMHRVDRVVYACPDPVGGACNIDPKNIRPWYERKWPIIEGPLLAKPSYELIIEYIKDRPAWKKIYDEFIEKIPKMIS